MPKPKQKLNNVYKYIIKKNKVSNSDSAYVAFTPALFSAAEANPEVFIPPEQLVWVRLDAFRDHWCELNNRTPVRLTGAVSGVLQVKPGAPITGNVVFTFHFLRW